MASHPGPDAFQRSPFLRAVYPPCLPHAPAIGPAMLAQLTFLISSATNWDCLLRMAGMFVEWSWVGSFAAREPGQQGQFSRTRNMHHNPALHSSRIGTCELYSNKVRLIKVHGEKQQFIKKRRIKRKKRRASMSTSLGVSLLGGAALRIGMLAWGHYQDTYLGSSLRFEDIDYSVFSDASRLLVTGCPLTRALKVDVEDALLEKDAYGPELSCALGVVPIMARFVLQNDPRTWSQEEIVRASQDFAFRVALLIYKIIGPILKPLAALGDPFARPTYRYTPALAALLSPTYLFGLPRDYGKFIFLAADLLCGVLMWKLVQGRRRILSSSTTSRLVSALWFFNPMPAQIAARGSAESVLGLLVLLFLYLFLQSNPELPPEGLEAAQAQVDKAYRAYDGVQAGDDADGVEEHLVSEAAPEIGDWSISGLAAPIVLAAAVHFKLFPIIYAAPVVAHLYITSGRRISSIVRWGLVAGTSLFLFNFTAWCL